jgi:hypothetical protein
VAEESKRLVQEWNKRIGEGFDKVRELSERTLHQPISPSRELNRANLDIRGQSIRPVAKNQSASPRVRETEQTQTRFRAGLSE